MIKTGKKILVGVWLLLIGLLLLALLLHPEWATPTYIVQCIQSFGYEVICLYLFLSLLRGIFFIPSTPFVLAGGLLFPDKLFLVLLISMAGVMFSATLLYYFAERMGLGDYLEKKYPKGMNQCKPLLQDSRSVFIVMGWSFFPFVPTDLICYAAGIVKMPFRIMFSGVFLGELILNIAYVYCGAGLFELLLSQWA